MDFAIVVHRAGKAGKLTAEVFETGDEAMKRFKSHRSGKTGFIRLRWAEMDKKVDHGSEHETTEPVQLDTGIDASPARRRAPQS